VIAMRLALCAAVLAVSACAGTQPQVVQAVPVTKIIMPVVQKKVLPSVSEVAVGEASWYGTKFHGRTTASGEPFDMNRLTAAHRTLPFGTRVRVVNEANGRSVVVRVNDRGPFAGRRIIDLSRAAAEKIGLRNQGVGVVKLEILSST
jgi:rare lipoprotein A